MALKLLALLLACLAFPGRVFAQSDDLDLDRDLDLDLDLARHWDLVTDVSPNGFDVPVRKYRSRISGLEIVLIQAESPHVSGVFCLATEAQDDDGLPHTLEHLIFLGSEEYPYKEFLDLTGNRCLADRTNAWTSVDSTCYTVRTAGAGGFLNILPIYLDHIFFPLLRDDDFVTEIHHVNGRGEDAGVVYSEMQAHLGSPHSIMNEEVTKLLYRGGSSYQYATGGKLENLRQNTTNAKIRNYHKRFYQPQNMRIIVLGEVEAIDIFRGVNSMERKYLGRQDTPFLRPFLTRYPPLLNHSESTVYYPDQEEKTGKILLGWRLPYFLGEGQQQLATLNVLANYLAGDDTSPLKVAFVHREEPLAASVYLGTKAVSQPSLMARFDEVPLERMDEIEPTFFRVLGEILEAGADGFDLKKLRSELENRKFSMMRRMENGAGTYIRPAILDFVYSRRDSEFAGYLSSVDRIQSLLQEPASFWLDQLSQLIKMQHVTVRGYPSVQMTSDMKAAEAERVRTQQAAMGSRGLAEAQLTVEAALASKKSPPAAALRAVPMADVGKITFKRLTHYNRTTPNHAVYDFDLRSLPFRLYLDDVNSNFVEIRVFFDVRHVAKKDRAYLLLLPDILTLSPLAVGGRMQNVSEVKDRQRRHTVGFGCSVDESRMLFKCAMTTRMETVEEALGLMRDTLYSVQFDLAKLTSNVARSLRYLPRLKLDGGSVSYSLHEALYYSKRSLHLDSSLLHVEKPLKRIYADLQRNPDQIRVRLDRVLNLVVSKGRTFVHVGADADKLVWSVGSGSRLAKAFRGIFKGRDQFEDEGGLDGPLDISRDYDFRVKEPKARHLIAGIPAGADSCHVQQSVAFDNVDPESSEQAEVELMLEYVNNLLYDRVRGKGLTYGIGLTRYQQKGCLQLDVYRSSQLAEAYAEFRRVMAEYSRPGAQWSEVILDSARGSTIYRLTSRESSVSGVVGQSLNSLLQNAHDPYLNRRFLRRISQVSLASVKAAARKYLPLFLDAGQLVTGVACGSQDVDKIRKAFKSHGIKMTKFQWDDEEEEEEEDEDDVMTGRRKHRLRMV